MAEDPLPIESPADSSPPPPADDSGSLSDHEAQFHGTREARAEPVSPPAETAPPEPETPEAGSAETEERDEKGRFKARTPKERRPASHDASPGDVPRIRELTARLRAAEAERDALKTRTGSSPVAAAPPPREAAPVPPTPKPTADQFTDYGDYIEALTDWKTDQKFAAAEQKRADTEHQRALVAEQQRITTSWTQRVTAAKAKYPDFEDVALLADTPIPQGSLIDAWILEHKVGADVLYHLQKHPDELDTLMAQPLFEQAEALALLSQRFNGSPSRSVAAPTGSVPAPPSPPVPRPPNPVRTGPMHSGDEPPDDEHSSLADHEKYYQPRRRRG